MIRIAGLTAALALVGALAACSAPHDGPEGAPDPAAPGGGTVSSAIADDLELDAALVTSEFLGVQMWGFTCDVSTYLSAESPSDVIPSASAAVTLGRATFTYIDAGGISDASGAATLPSAFTSNFHVDLPDGYWHLSTELENTTWSAGLDFALRAVPVPEDGCSAATLWARDMISVGTDLDEMERAFSEDGLRNVATECPDASSEWVPPNLSCEEYELRVDEA